SGLPLWFNETFDAQPKFQYGSLDDYLPLYGKLEVDPKKQGTYSYSNVGFITLGFVIEAITGNSFSTYLQEAIFQPLQMHETGVYTLTEIIPHMATGYVRPSGPGDHWKTNHHLNKGGSPAGGIYSSPEDLIKFYRGLVQGQLLQKSSVELMMTPWISTPFGKYGYGIALNEINGSAVYGHLGGYYGARGELMWYKEADVMVAILANSDQTDYIDLSHYIQTMLVGREAEQKAYAHTLRLIRSVEWRNWDGKTPLNLDTNLSYDEALIQIKGYYHFNQQSYNEAEKLFQLNVLLFPESQPAQRDLERVRSLTR
ncbi:MAG: serine hydrolase domain-containing protein, partial [Bacteroidota bacterium]